MGGMLGVRVEENFRNSKVEVDWGEKPAERCVSHFILIRTGFLDNL